MRVLLILIAMLAAACTPVVAPPPAGAPSVVRPAAVPAVSGRQAIRNFEIAVARVAPVAEQMCRARRPRDNCDFLIVVDDRPGLPPNAFQTLDRSGRPVLGFTLALIAEARNVDEIAFVMAHEAAHHIAGHIARAQDNATVGALVGGTIAAALGVSDPDAIDSALRLGATVGVRRYSKDFELEADALGTRIAAAAGFDPLRGAQFFFRIPDPGDRFLGTHPPNADRLRTVERVAAGL